MTALVRVTENRPFSPVCRRVSGARPNGFMAMNIQGVTVRMHSDPATGANPLSTIGTPAPRGTDHTAPRVKPPAMVCRRGLIARLLGGWLARRAPFFAASLSGSAAIAALCSEWRCPGTIARACLAVLPAAEMSEDRLTRIVLEDIRTVEQEGLPVRALARAIRERSWDDFREGRIAMVDGWMLSLTETRVYALTALLGRSAA